VRFSDRRTVSFYSGSPALDIPLKSYRVRTHGSAVPEEIPAPTLVPGARIVAQFAVTGTRLQLILVGYPDRSAPNLEGVDFVHELFLVDGKNLVQLTNFGRADTGQADSFIARGRAFFHASADPFGENPAGIDQLFSINTRGSDLRQLTRLPSDGRGCGIHWFGIVRDRVTGTVLFATTCDPVGRNPFGAQIFAMAPDGTGLRQLTATRGRTIDPYGTVRVEIPGPFASTSHHL
jgi:hypothetical protein